MIDQWVKEAVAAADNPEHEWDRKAIDWPLTSESIVFEIGAFKGRWALQIARQYNPQLYVFEPQVWAYEVTKRVLQHHSAQVFNYGLGDSEAVLPMGEFGTDGCSFVRTTRAQGPGQIRDIATVLADLRVDRIDLALINIEGFEYILIPHMLKKRILPKWLMVQFHDYEGIDYYKELRARIEKRHYKVLWDYGKRLVAYERRTGGARRR
jgi:FkbM family methyltransferase